MSLSLILKALILCFGLILPVSNVENNEASIPYYNYNAKLPEYVMDHTFVYQDPPYGRVLDFTIDMSNYEDLTSARIYIPFIRHYNDGNINYKISLTKSDGSILTINEGVNKPTDYNYKGQFNIPFDLPVNELGMKGEIKFETWEDGASYTDWFTFFLTSPNEIYPADQYAIIYSYVVFKEDVLHNYEERIEFLNLPKELYIENYFKMYTDYIYIRYNTINKRQKFREGHLLFLDEPGYLRKPFKEYDEFPGYYGANLDYFDDDPYEGILRVFYQRAYYLDLETLMMSNDKYDFTYNVAVRDLFFPVNKFEEYKYFPMKLILKNVGRSSTDIIYDFVVIFGDEHIQETLSIGRDNPVKEFTPYMETVNLWFYQSYFFH